MKKARGPSEVDRKTNFRIIIFSLSPFPLYVTPEGYTGWGKKEQKGDTDWGEKDKWGSKRSINISFYF